MIDDAFQCLTAGEREGVFLRFYEGKDYATIAAPADHRARQSRVPDGEARDLLTLDWSRISSQAQQILTPAQFRILSEDRDAFVNESAINRAERAAQGEWLRARRQKK